MKKLVLSLCSLVAVFSYGQFIEQSPLTSYSTGHKSFAADINSDGKNDFVFYNEYGIQWRAANEDNAFQVIHNAYTISLDSPQEYIIIIAPEDIDGDGDVDIAFGTQGDTGPGVAWLENIGGGEFSEPTVLIEGVSLRNIYFEDIDVDGDMDLIANTISGAEMYQRRVVVLENNGGGVFSEPVVIDFYGLNEKKSYCGDIDGDGDLDLVVAVRNDNNMFWYENLGDFVFGDAQFITADFDGISGLITIDMELDGDLDVLFLSYLDNKIAWQENLGDGTFGDQHMILSMDNINLLMAEDIDLDGDLDLLFTNYSEELYAKINILENISPGVFEAPFEVGDSVYQFSSFSYADMNADGIKDILSEGSINGSYSYLPNLGDGTFAPTVSLIGMLRSPRSLISADLDLDGDSEMISVNKYDSTLVFFDNQGEYKFGIMNTISSGIDNPNNCVALDFDLDGDLDLLVSGNGETSLVSFENLGDATFGPMTIIDVEMGITNKLLLVDIDGDGDDDVVRGKAMGTYLSWLENTGAGLGAEIDIVTTIEYPKDIECGDIDLDGDIDLLVMRASGLNQVSWIENLGGSFATETDLMEQPCSDIVFTDINGDGLLDIVGVWNTEDPGELSSYVFWYESLGDELFGDQVLIYEGGIEYSKILSKDLDGNGKVDLVISTDDYLEWDWEDGLPLDNLSWISNLGDGEFSSPNLISNQARGIRTVILEDFDEDGDPDIASVSTSDSKIVWYKNLFVSPGQAKGNLYYDENENGIKDIDEIGFENISVGSVPLGGFSFTFPNGDYILNFDDIADGDYIVSPEDLEHWEITSDVEEYLVTVDDDFTGVTDMNFGFYPSDTGSELEMSLVGGFPRCGAHANYFINYTNTGGVIAEGVVSIELDEALTYVEAEVLPDSIVDGVYFWSYSDLFYFDENLVKLTVEMPGFDAIGDTLVSYATVTSLDDLGVELFSITDSVSQQIVCAYDPNDKTVFPQGVGDFGDIPPSVTYLEYMIRFQNTGTDTAFTVVIKDQLDPNLDWTSLTPIASSHSMNTYVNATGEVSFSFNDIMLPDSNVNVLGSQGFVKFGINLLPDLPLGTVINNTGHIYFDANPAVVTNTVINTIALTEIDDLGIDETGETSVKVYPNPFSDYATVIFKEEPKDGDQLIIYDLLGKEVYKEGNLNTQLIIYKEDLGAGVYFLGLVNNTNLIYTTKLIVH